jgi:hypothetical protein
MCLEYQISAAEINSSIHSDHSIVEIVLEEKNKIQNGKGFWKFNSALLTDKHYITKVKECIMETIENHQNLEDKNLLWDLTKCKLRGMTISHSSYKAKEKRQLEEELKTKLNELEKNIHKNDDILPDYETTKRELEDLQRYKVQGIMIRSRAKFVEAGERNTKYFLNLEKHNQNIKNIKCLIDENGTTITQANKILDEQVHFYKALYMETDPERHLKLENEYFLSGNLLPKLTEYSKSLCDQELTLEECGQALKQLPNNKSPGSDGFTTEFYKFFWPDIRNLLIESYLYSFRNGKLSIDQRRGILSIIPKKDQDLRLLKNWRPLCLLNTDYKILTKVLVNRLQNVLNDIVHTDQNGFIKGRFIGENIRLITDIIEYSKRTKIKGLITLLDFEKAFDTVNWHFLQNTLKAFNFGNTFRRWINIIYADITSCCLNNGNATTFFEISRGVRQGCPASGLLFILVVETMANSLRSDSKISGIQVDDKCIKISQLADDTSLFLRDEKSLSNALDLLEKFHVCSGLKLNKSKTKLFCLGNTNHRPTILSLATTEHFKTLGVSFSNNIEDMSVVNLEERYNKFQSVINIWKQRDLSLKGKITILKSLALPQLTYITNVTHVSKTFTDKVHRCIQNFMWNNKPPKIKNSTLIADIKHGGLKMPHFETMIKSQKIMWIKRLLNDRETNWKTVAFKQIGLSADVILSRQSLSYLNQNLICSSFYKQILQNWYEFYSIEPNEKFLYYESLWNNKYILINNKPAFYKHWQSNGITCIKDILDAKNNIISIQNISSKFKVHISAMDYNSIVHAIPHSWKDSLKNNDITFTQPKPGEIYVGNTSYFMSTLCNQTIYWHLLENITKQPTAIDNWISEFPFLNDKDFENFFQLPHAIVKDTKLQTFQYKILNQIIPCKARLFKWKMTDDYICQYCNEYDDHTHFFYTCYMSKEFWDQITNWIFNVLQVRVYLSKTDILFGIINTEQNQLFNCLNYIILHGKRYIYVTKLNKIPMFSLDFLVQLKNNLEIDKYALSMNGKFDKFFNKFGLLYEALF